MQTVTLTLPKPHSGQASMLRDARRYNVAACGRRFGKSTLAIELLSRPALEAQPVAYFSPTYKLLIEVWRQFQTTLWPVIRRSNATEHRIELVTGGVIECWSMENADAGRSRRYARVVVDEAGLVADLGERWQAAIRPTLADLRGDAWLMGTPKGRNFFWECYLRGQDATHPDWVSWQKPTSANPYISADEVAAMQRELTERRFAQEIRAEFIDDAGGVFRGVADCATAQSTPRQDGHLYVMGCDWGKYNDYTVLTVIDATTHQMVALDRFNQIDYTLQLGRVQALAERYSPEVIIAEKNSIGDPILERLYYEHNLPVQPFTTTNASKAKIIDALSLAFERRTIGILSDPVLIGELQAFEAERLPGGLLRYSAPESMHDDCVMSLAMCWHGAQWANPVE